jgi:hypothetical protein
MSEELDNNFQFRKDESFGDFLHILREDKETTDRKIHEEDKKDEPSQAPQNLKTEEEPEVDPEDLDLEDHDKDDFNKAGAKIKPDSDANKDLAIEEVPEDKKQRIDGSKNESKDPLWLCNNCDKTFRNSVDECIFCLSNMTERITPVSEGEDVPFDSDGRFSGLTDNQVGDLQGYIEDLTDNYEGVEVYNIERRDGEYRVDFKYWSERRQTTSHDTIYCTFRPDGPADGRLVDFEVNESKVHEDNTAVKSQNEVVAKYQKFRAQSRSREEAVQATVKAYKGEIDAPTLRNLLMTKGVREWRDKIPGGKYKGKKNTKEGLSWEKQYAEWEQQVIEEFLLDYPDHKEYVDAGKVEVGEKGEVFVHKGGAYPMIVKGYTPWGEQEGVRESEDDKYNPEKNLKSEITELFYTKEFALVDEHKSATGVHLEYKRGDELVKVFIED